MGQINLFRVLPDGTRGEAVMLMGARGTVIRPNTFPRTSFTCVSHQWCRPSVDPTKAHPDTLDARKLRALQSFVREKDLVGDYIWMDYYSIPQDISATRQQMDAIRSLPAYFVTASNVVAVSENASTLRDPEYGYLSRGWCLLELASAKLPRRDAFGRWYLPGLVEGGDWGELHTLEWGTMESHVLGWDDYIAADSPMEGNFTVESDRDSIRPLVESYVQMFKFFAGLIAQVQQHGTMAAYEAWAEAAAQASGEEEPLLQCLEFKTHSLGRVVRPETAEETLAWCKQVLPEEYWRKLELSVACTSTSSRT